MCGRRLLTVKYTIAAEGKTEKWYLEWLNNIINDNNKSTEFRCLISVPYTGRCPHLARLKIRNLTDENYCFLADREHISAEVEFRQLLRELKPSEGEREIEFELGYCNMSFELWLLLHKIDYTTPVSTPDEYLKPINKAFGTTYERLADFKKERNFKRILQNLTLEDVKDAIRRAEAIERRNKKDGVKVKECCGYKYYNENPSLSIHKIIKEIFKKFDIPV